jgi:DNA-binding beta-propeller fold protein YncE
VAIDPMTRTIYWANDSGNPISYAKLDGSGGAALDTLGSTPDRPYGAAIDLAGGRIYWANRGDPTLPDTHPSTISYANLDGSGGGGQLNVSGATPFQARFPVLLRAPSGAGAPQIAGGSRVGSALTCSQGAWAPDELGSFLYRAPVSVAYQWSRNRADVAGATGSSYTSRIAGTYSCRVTATNQAGSTSQTSAALSVKDPKCKRLRRKLKHQNLGLAKAGSDAKRGTITAGIEDTTKRLKKLGC